MTVARAFPYLRYNADVVGDPGQLLAPPYDVIDEAERERLAAESPYQSVLLELPAEGNLAGAGKLLRQWIDEGVLEAGEVGFAVIQQRYTGPDGVRRTRIGIACEIGLHEFSEGKVLPHERTFEGPRRTRLELMEHTGANVSPVFALYHDPEKSLADLVSSVTDEEPDCTSNDADGTQTAVWFVTDTALCDVVEEAVAPHPLLIADGHHRYTAALAWREQAASRGTKLAVVGGSAHAGAPHTTTTGPNGVLAVVANSADPGICVFPTHRIVRGADPSALEEFVVGSGAFNVTDFTDISTAMVALDGLQLPGFVVHGAGAPTRLFALTDPTDLELATPDVSDASRALDVVALHALVLDGGALLAEGASVAYTRDLTEAVAAATTDDSAMVFLTRAPSVEQVLEVAQAGDLLPQKSTYFYPKVPTGVVFRTLEPLG